MSDLILIQGFLGAGKSTFSTNLAREIQAVRLNADEWVDWHFSSDQQAQNWNQCYDQAITEIWNLAASHLDAGQKVILDNGFWSLESRDYARNFARTHNAQTKLYYIFAPDDVLIERLKTRIGPVAKNNIENFSHLKRSFEPPYPYEDAIMIYNY